MLLRSCGIALICGVVLGPVGASAATVSNQGGTILVTKGEGFVPIAGDVEVVPGAQVMVRPGGLATIAYGRGCVVRVGSGVWLVQEETPCTEGIAVIDFTGRMNQGAPPTEPPADPPEEPPPGINTTTALLIGGVVAGGIGLAVVLSQGDDKPASP